MKEKLNIGDSVIFMDSDLRGKIISVSPKTEVELEDGFVIQAYPGEFFVVDPSEVKKLEQISSVQKSKEHKSATFSSKVPSPRNEPTLIKPTMPSCVIKNVVG